MSARRFFVCAFLIVCFAHAASAARYQRTKDGKVFVWNSLRGVAQDVTWSGAHDSNGYATGNGTLTWYRLGTFVNSYTGKMVHGKFEGPVIREQGNTRLEASFAQGEKVGPWLEPGSSLPSPSPSEKPATPREKPATPTPTAERPALEETPLPMPAYEPPTPLPTLPPNRISAPSVTPTATPTPIPVPSSTATPTPRPRPTLTPTPQPTAAPTTTARPTPIPTPQPTATPTARPAVPPTFSPAPLLTPPTLRSFGSPSVQERPSTEVPKLEETIEGPADEPLALPSPPPSLRNALEEMPMPETSAPPVTRSTPAPLTASRQSAGVKGQIVTQFRKDIESVLAEARTATNNFRPIEHLEGVRALPASVSARITFLANQGRIFRTAVGYETSRFQYLDEIQAVDALVSLDEITRDLAGKDAPAARKEASTFVKTYSEPSSEDGKALWRYLNSAFSLCERAKDEAASHLPHAQSSESAGRKSEALRDYQEIYRIYPNPITADKIKQLQGHR